MRKSCVQEKKFWDGKMTYWVKVIAINSRNLNLIPRIHAVE